jgi:group I intron endonuclease
MMNTSAVYEIRNVSSGKSYIGSAMNYQRRLTNHFSNLRHNRHPNPHLQASFNAYSESAFVARAILICEPFELLRYEQAMIDMQHPEYNIVPKAGAPNRGKGFKMSAEAVEKSRQARIGKARPDMKGKALNPAGGPKETLFQFGQADPCSLEAHHRGATTLKATNSQSERMKLWWATRKLAQG